MADQPADGRDQEGRQGVGAPTQHLEIFFRTFTRPVIYVLVLLGLHLFLRGHGSPGGGFIAGLVIAVAALLSRIVLDRPLVRGSPDALIPWGLLLAFATGVVPLFFGLPFLTSDYGYVTWPLIGEFEWATAVLFDAGVFLVVVGTTLTIIELLAGNTDETLSDYGQADGGSLNSPRTDASHADAPGRAAGAPEGTD